VVVVAVACGHHGDAPVTSEARKDGGTVAKDAAAAEIPARPLGAPDLATFQWRKRAGQAAFAAARKAENREDWGAVVTAAREAVTADSTHLEAQWLLAVALAKTGHDDALLAPLQAAAAGDFGKWALASLEQPALQGWLATPAGEAWRRRVDADRATYAAALARSLVVAAHGDLFAFDPEGTRWYRLTRTYGAVIAAYRGTSRIAYVTRGKTGFGVGTIELATGRSTRPASLGAAQPPVALALHDASFWVGPAWKELDAEGGKLKALPGKPARPEGAWLEVFKHNARLHQRVGSVAADWDDQSLASAMRVGHSNRVVTVPSPGLIDGNTAVWAPDQAHLAFVAQLDDHCTPGSAAAAAFVADATTGTARELERATGGLAIEWVGAGKLAIAGDHGVALVSIDGGAPLPLEGADGLVTPRRKPRCIPEPTDEPAPVDTDETSTD
jgi:hypothetical protein